MEKCRPSAFLSVHSESSVDGQGRRERYQLRKISMLYEHMF